MDDQEPVRQRLTKLREEYAAGQAMIQDLDRKREELCATMLRISGAIQVLEELLGDASPQPPSASGAG